MPSRISTGPAPAIGTGRAVAAYPETSTARAVAACPESSTGRAGAGGSVTWLAIILSGACVASGSSAVACFTQPLQSQRLHVIDHGAAFYSIFGFSSCHFLFFAFFFFVVVGGGACDLFALDRVHEAHELRLALPQRRTRVSVAPVYGSTRSANSRTACINGSTAHKHGSIARIHRSAAPFHANTASINSTTAPDLDDGAVGHDDRLLLHRDRLQLVCGPRLDTSAPLRVDTSAPLRVDTSAPLRVDTSAPLRVDTSAPLEVDEGPFPQPFIQPLKPHQATTSTPHSAPRICNRAQRQPLAAGTCEVLDAALDVDEDLGDAFVLLLVALALGVRLRQVRLELVDDPPRPQRPGPAVLDLLHFRLCLRARARSGHGGAVASPRARSGLAAAQRVFATCVPSALTLCTLHSTLCTLHLTLCTLHLTLCT
eukprot:1743034-Rhodomonas_salina.1